MGDGLDEAAVLRDRLREEAESKGLIMIGFALLPGRVGGPHAVQVVMEVRSTDKPDIEIMEEIEDDLAGMRREAIQSEAADGLQELARKLDDPPSAGIL